MKKVLVLAAAAIAVSGCSSVIEGTSQTLSFESNPPGANCSLERNNAPIGNVTTPGGIVVQKTKHNILVTCKKEGYQDAKATLKSEVAGATFGNIILGGGIGWAIDSASGADNKYNSITTVSLVPLDKAVADKYLQKTERLNALQKLFDDKAITEAEYTDRRKKIIDEI
jgi:hypothetical protein